MSNFRDIASSRDFQARCRDVVAMHITCSLDAICTNLLSIAYDGGKTYFHEEAADLLEQMDCFKKSWDTFFDDHLPEDFDDEWYEAALEEMGQEEFDDLIAKMEEAGIAREEIECVRKGNISDWRYDLEVGKEGRSIIYKQLRKLEPEDGGSLDDLCDRAHFGDGSNEVLDWYAVDHWLHNRLKERGEFLARNVCGFPYVWGRQQCNQGVASDEVIEHIVYHEFFEHG